jgi:TolB-like protein/Flp pilus assembly protein TadD
MQPGSRIAHFEILGLIGSGGMGEVYRARDTRLGRDVAIKVLPAEFASDPERLKRFEQEARAVAALSHPNILAIFDVGSAPVSSRAEGEGSAVTGEALHFLVTELLEGESLRERLRSGPLPVRKAVELGVGIANGLAAAHEKGIIHRDLKPGNLFITRDGHVKILDFGVAKLTPLRTPEDQAKASTIVEATEAGMVLGTLGYMSPEQVRGQTVDHRSDIFSFGCVLYEMLAGKAPFARHTGLETASAVLNDDPEPLTSFGKPIAPGLRDIVWRCLEKRPEERFTSAHDLALALPAYATGEAPGTGVPVRPRSSRRRVVGVVLIGVAVLAAVGVLVIKLRPAGVTGGAGVVKKIVVLPFENLGLPEDAYFASGMAEEITSRLANVHGLGVISRTSAVECAKRGKTVKEIGAELGVDYVLEGSVRFEHGQGKESRVRITPQLIRVADDTHVWADRYDRVLADVFAIQTEVAENAVRAMDVALQPYERSALKEVSTTDLEAYNFYLRGQEFFAAGEDKQHVEEALKMYDAAADRDPRFAQALAGLARCHLLMYWAYFDRSEDRVVKAKEAAERAVMFRPDLAETHAALGYYYYRGSRDYERALDEFAKALRIQPGASVVHEGIGYVLRRQGHWKESADEIKKATDSDPKNAVLVFNLGRSWVLAHSYADADRAFQQAIGLSPEWNGPYATRASLQVRWRGDLDKAQAILDEAGRVPGLRDGDGLLAQDAAWLAMLHRDYEGALRVFETQPPHAFEYQNRLPPISLMRGEALMLAGRREPARRTFETVRLELEQTIKQDPGDGRFHSSLGIAYAGLGRREDAVRAAKRGCDLMPASKDAWMAQSRLYDLALVYTMTGQVDEAIATLDDVLSRSGSVTPHVLRLDPAWDPLRSDPRFQALLKKYAVEE